MTDIQKVRILIGADIVPTSPNQHLFDSADTKALVGEELCGVLASADIRIFNLEVPLADRESPISKCGPCLRAPTSSAAGIKALDPTYLTLANNHIMDHGEAGLRSTLAVLDNAGIEYGGVGSNLGEAAKAWTKTVNGINIGIYSCAEHEFSIASESSCGANPFDPLESYDAVAELAEHCDFVIVLYHGGKEYYRYPSPMLQRYCRKFIDKGADLVVCQHSHCIGCEEKYGGGTIVYGQGNFIFEKYDNEFFNSAMLIEAELTKEQATVGYIPLVRKAPGVRLAGEEERSALYSAFLERSEQIARPGFIGENYRRFAQSMQSTVMGRIDFGANGALTRILNKLSRGAFSRRRCSKAVKAKANHILNTVECEAWSELLKTILSQNSADR